MPFNAGTRKSKQERLQDAKAAIDPLYPFFPEYGDFDFYNVITQATPNDLSQRRNMLDCQEEIKHILEIHKYISKVDTLNLRYQLTELGRSVKAMGGHVAYVNAKKSAQERAGKEENLRMQELELNVANMQKQLSDYEANKWKAKVNLFVAIVSALIALAALIVSVVKK